MSAYGSLPTRPESAPLPTTIYTLPKAPNNDNFLTLHHLTLSRALTYPGIIDTLYAAFAAELERGLTYPQEDITADGFNAYFFAADVIVGILTPANKVSSKINDGDEIEISIDEARGGKSWEECITGFYYVKPNYPGRSSHLCNGGFVVPYAHRARGYGSVLARSFLYYAPRLGYRGSVFNLVYINNFASVKMWEKLGFTIVGKIPGAGRLKKSDGTDGEEYVDAYVIYKSFVTE